MKPTWTPTWLSLAAAMMWVVSRNAPLTKTVAFGSGSDCSIELGISGLLAYDEMEAGQRDRFIEIVDAWPALRRLIADEKILAEGRSILRRGFPDVLETRYSNEPIPSGDAAHLAIRSGVPGIGPRDALAPDDSQPFMGWQGRFWYDVRLQASDVFRQFTPCQNHWPLEHAAAASPPHLAGKVKKEAPSARKIREAIEAEEVATLKPFPTTLTPGQRNKRLWDRMNTMGLRRGELPDQRQMRSFFNEGPAKPAKSG
ncbi:MAG: hypothetical protein ABL907_18245 [Hyphomicrobium sp.]